MTTMCRARTRRFSLTIAGVKRKAERGATLWRVDENNGNAFAAWKKMGSPQSPNATQYQELELASGFLPQALKPQSARRGTLLFDVAIPRQGVALLVLD